ncbi:hypothetical protein [Pseudomonas sp. NPDC088444]|uniref:glycine zipper domain-containing protein n=1 Tax=Pseudomonas sp. NPDC088444 TaxID=3364456 RepID=UPI00384C275D
MSQMIDDLSESLTDDLYRKTRNQINTFINETNALLAAGDVLREDRTRLARARLAEFLSRTEPPAPAADAAPPLAKAAVNARRFVEAHPWAAVGAAAGVGLIVSLWLRHRD